jgi:RNA polymerase sigma factor (sigma-70 family)
VSPLLLRRYRADRLLRDEFETLRATVTAGVAARLRAVGLPLDAGDLDACYAQAWHGLYAVLLEGRQVVNPAGWLAVVTHRRAIDELRARGRVEPLAGEPMAPLHAQQREVDLAATLDDRRRLRNLFEALRARLSVREQQAATLCYLHGLSRAEAAAQMGVSESRMRKLMDGAGDGLLGVAAKVAALARTIAAGEWCEQQGSLMRGFAFGILDPEGERYELALRHSEDCSACRGYVLSLRGLAAALPPLPGLLHLVVGSAVSASAGAGAGAGAGLGTGTGSAGAGASGAATVSGAAAPAGTLFGSALSASGAAGGGWWLAGPMGAKLAVGCLLALGVGAGCVAVEGTSSGARAPGRHRHARAEAHVHGARAAGREARLVSGYPPAARAGVGGGVSADSARAAPTAAGATRASREFGPERPSVALAPSRASPSPGATATSAQIASTRAPQSAGAAPSAGATRSAASLKAGAASSGRASSGSGSTPAAQREFAPG